MQRGTSNQRRLGGARPVLNNISKQVRKCLRHAEDCSREAAAHPDGSPLRQDFLEMENRWLKLALSIELTERLNAPKPTLH
jgi:hypothetical protein